MSLTVAAVVTAAGESTRMGGFPKPLLWFDGERFVERVVARLEAAGVDEPVVVLGYEAEAVRERADLDGATVIVDDDYESGMLSSVRAGVRRAQAVDADALLLWPVDYPCAPASVAERLVERYASGTEPALDVVIPTVDGDRGHPALFGAATFDALLAASGDEGARAVVYDPGTTVVDLPVDDPRIHVDVDTPAEYWDAVRRFE